MTAPTTVHNRSLALGAVTSVLLDPIKRLANATLPQQFTSDALHASLVCAPILATLNAEFAVAFGTLCVLAMGELHRGHQTEPLILLNECSSECRSIIARASCCLARRRQSATTDADWTGTEHTGQLSTSNVAPSRPCATNQPAMVSKQQRCPHLSRGGSSRSQQRQNSSAHTSQLAPTDSVST